MGSNTANNNSLYKSSHGVKRKGRKRVIAAEIRISLCSPRRVFVVPPKVLLPSYPTAPTLTLSSLGPEQGIIRSHRFVGNGKEGTYLLLLFMVLEDVFDLFGERFEAKPLVYDHGGQYFLIMRPGDREPKRETDLESTDDMLGCDRFL
jgi:hypothetical protein